MELGAGEEPKKWTKVAKKLKKPVAKGVLGEVDPKNFAGSKVWIIRIRVKHKNGKERENRFKLTLG